MRVHSPPRRMRIVAALVLSAGIATTPSIALATDSAPSPGPTLLTIPLASQQAFDTTNPSNPACPAGGGGPTSKPSVTPTVLGVTFNTPPPSTPTPTKPGGRLPFTGLPLVQSLLAGSALIVAGGVLRYSRRRHRFLQP